MTAPAMLRVMPTGDLPVPSHDGKQHRMLRRAEAPIGGFLVPDTLHNRRRVQFGELLLLAEGAEALKGHGEAAVNLRPAAPAPTPAAPPVAATAEEH